MSKKHFEALAAKFQSSKPLVPVGADSGVRVTLRYQARLQQWYTAVADVADVCTASCPAFNRQRFYDACNALAEVR